jgi:hypothetical protein
MFSVSLGMYELYCQADGLPDMLSEYQKRATRAVLEKKVYIARNLRDRKLQRVLMQFFKPENRFTVREAFI